MAEVTKSHSGVQELITRIRDDGVRAGNEEADRILAAARAEAGRIVDEARAQADALREKTRAEIETERSAAMEALRMASRDTVLEMKGRVTTGFERYVRRLVTTVTLDGKLLRAVVLVLAGRAAKEFIKDKNIEVLVSDTLFGDKEPEEMSKREREAVLSISADMLRKGIELIPASDVHGGARVRLEGEDIEIDLSDEAISALLLKYMLPRFRAILEGTE